VRRPEGVLAVVGPTATGKSELAAALAERLGGEIVSADAFAVYRGFDAGTAKPGPDLLARAPHHLVDAREPTEPWSAGEFASEARRLCDEILARGRLPILAGGTGFYVRAFFGGLFEGPRRDDAVRAALEAVAARRGAPSSIPRSHAGSRAPTRRARSGSSRSSSSRASARRVCFASVPERRGRGPR
jgi:tRNA dimethylallyltransferase